MRSHSSRAIDSGIGFLSTSSACAAVAMLAAQAGAHRLQAAQRRRRTQARIAPKMQVYRDLTELLLFFKIHRPFGNASLGEVKHDARGHVQRDRKTLPIVD